MRKYRHIFWKPRRSTWVVAIVRVGHAYEKRFSTKLYFSKARALVAALKWRNDLYRLLNLRIVKARDPRNRSGIIGVSLIRKTKASGRKYWYWTASWRRGPRDIRKTFAVDKYGDAKARAMAIAARKCGISTNNAK